MEREFSAVAVMLGLPRFVVLAVSEVEGELEQLATTIDSWRSELLAHFTTDGISNGPTEAINLLIKKLSASDTDSATSTTTGFVYCCVATSTGTLSKPHRS